MKSNPKILVTGADGFIGSHLVEELLHQGFAVRALCLYNSLGNLGWLEEARNHPNLEICLGDIRDRDVCEEICIGIETIYHLAALISIPWSYKAPQSYFETNVQGTLNMGMAAIKCGTCKKFVQMSTSEVYGTALYAPIDEKHPKQPQSPYSASKIAADATALSLYYTYQLPVVVARAFNTYGPRQSARAVIPSMMSQILSGKRTIDVGDLSPTRDFNYVQDTVQGLIQLSQCSDALGLEVNLGSGSEISIADLFHTIADVCGVKVEFKVDPDRMRPAGSEVRRLLANNQLAKDLFNYQPQINLFAGLSAVKEWMEPRLQTFKPDRLML